MYTSRNPLQKGLAISLKLVRCSEWPTWYLENKESFVHQALLVKRLSLKKAEVTNEMFGLMEKKSNQELTEEEEQLWHILVAEYEYIKTKYHEAIIMNNSLVP